MGDFYVADFVKSMLAWGMARACSLSLILFPRASALYKIITNDFHKKKSRNSFLTMNFYSLLD
ncbi:hypothetical protein CD108_05785 [Mammaliicoccus vitulinus]|nr:hypothetical protein CD108_05785 [Mammaliicoccus vitulinus]